MTDNKSSKGSARPRILFLCQNLPFPPDAGAHIRSFHTLRLMSSRFSVTALCFHRAGTRPDEASVTRGLEGLSRLPEVEAASFPIPQEQDAARLAWDHARTIFTGRPFVWYAYDTRAVRGEINRLIQSQGFHLVHIDSLDLAAYIPRLIQAGLPIVCAHHNVESDLLSKRADVEESRPRRAYISLQARFMRRLERRWCPRVALNIAVSADDRQRLQEIAPASRVIVVPNGVDTTQFRPSDLAPRPDTIVFVGGWGWFPNRDGMDFFVASILPILRSEKPQLQVTWVGRAPPDVRAAYEAHGVTMTGFVDDIRPYLYQAACFVAPLRVGGGTRLKILDAWACGKAIVSTTQAAEGLATRHGENILLGDDPKEFASHVLEVLHRPDVRRVLESEGRKTAVERYDWSVVGDPMLDALTSLASRSVSPTSPARS